MKPTRGNYDISSVDGFSDLLIALERVNSSDDPVGEVADLLLNGHKGVSGYLTFGNNKIAKNTGIFNMNSATDCPNADSQESDQSPTGVCQVPWSDCYAHKAENIYPDALKKRRLQEYLWDNIDADTFAKALLQVKARKRTEFSYLRMSESGDFRHKGDVCKVDRIAEIVSPEIEVYTYSASHKLDWSDSENFTVNQSNNLDNYGDRQFTATYTDESGDTKPITKPSDVPEDMILCPFEAAKHNGVDTENRPKCGDCTHCIDSSENQPKDVAIIQH